LIGGLTFADLLRFEGWDVDFLGADSPIDSIVEMVERESPDLVGLSVTIEEYLPNANDTVTAIKALPNPPVVVLGGAAVDRNSILEADYSSADAVKAVNWVQAHFNLNDASVTIEVMLEELGARIQTLRKDKGLSQQQLATEADLDRSYISAVEHGKQNVSFATLKGISDALGIGVAELISG
jgi:cobalamin-dependent methionine synthase I